MLASSAEGRLLQHRLVAYVREAWRFRSSKRCQNIGDSALPTAVAAAAALHCMCLLVCRLGHPTAHFNVGQYRRKIKEEDSIQVCFRVG